MVTSLSFEDVVEMHDIMLERYGGLPGIRDEGVIRFAISLPDQSLFGQESYDTITKKAAAMAFSLIDGHPFFDGNKRVGFYAMLDFLGRNGYDFFVSDEEADSFIRGVAAGTKNRDDLEAWIDANGQPIE